MIALVLMTTLAMPERRWTRLQAGAGVVAVLVVIAAGFTALGLPLWAGWLIAAAAIAVFLLAEPRVRRQGDGLDLWVLVDRSDSGWEELAPRLPEMETILEKSRGVDDRVFFVDFAAEAQTPLVLSGFSSRLAGVEIRLTSLCP